ncbi:hypothetical protein [Streptomyces sp. NPDC007264]|uniref:hypothetical protein n=1 Tax=Streptomyces sp. NPDC007264 TaxID=3364777 RepID=UPI0036D9ECCA
MHRTTTTATLLLVTVAVSALSGCVTVQRPPAPGAPPAPSRPSAPRPDGSGQPHAVQAPAREALEMVRPSDVPSPSAAARHGSTARPDPGAAWTAGPHRPSTTPSRSLPGPYTGGQPTASVAIPGNADVCALGRSYGRWRPDSPEATICGRVYGP